jgi:hypothetical protein
MLVFAIASGSFIANTPPIAKGVATVAPITNRT